MISEQKQFIIYVMIEKYHNHPYLRILQRQTATEQIDIRNEYAKSTYKKLNAEEKEFVHRLTAIDNLGELGATQILAAIGQVLDSVDWPRKNGD